MPSLEGLGPAILVTLLLVVMLWFAFGTQRNIRRGNLLLRWLQDGLPLIGRRTTLRWLGSSAVELEIAHAEPPFRDATVLVVLEPRDVGLLWAWGRSRGRRDFLIVRTNLLRAPTFSLEVGDPRGWTGRLDATAEPWRVLDWPDGCVARATSGADAELARSAWRRLSEVSNGVWRLVIQPVVPHLEVHLRPPPDQRIPAQRVIEPIARLAAGLVER